MTSLEPAQLGANWQGHKSALHWIKLLVTRPLSFIESLPTSRHGDLYRLGLRLLLHASPYIVAFQIIQAYLLAHFSFGWNNVLAVVANTLVAIVAGAVGGSTVGLLSVDVPSAKPPVSDAMKWLGQAAVFVSVLFAGVIISGLLEGILTRIFGTTANHMISYIRAGIAIAGGGGVWGLGAFVGSLLVPTNSTVVIGASVSGGIAGGMIVGLDHPEWLDTTDPLLLIYFSIGVVVWILYCCHFIYRYYSVVSLRVMLNALVDRRPDDKENPRYWRDALLPELDRLLVAYAEDPACPADNIDHLIAASPIRRIAALRAKAALLTREAGQRARPSALDDIAARLPPGSESLLPELAGSFDRMRAIARQQRDLDTVQTPTLREPLARALRADVENLQHSLGGVREPLATEFRLAAAQWFALADRQWQDARAIAERAQAPHVFRAGDAVDRAQEAFVPRRGVSGDIERQLMLATGCPGLVLYGRRRTGKSTILRNLDLFLPNEAQMAVVSMQDPEAFTSLDSFSRRIATAVATAWPNEPAAMPPQPGLTGLFALLGRANERLATENRRLLLALDEYENIDQKIGDRVFTEDLLATLRESIQTRRRIVWIFAGSHDITELTHAPWTSYLVSARTIEVPLFTEAETRALLTEPLRYSPLWPPDDPRRPHFPPALWGHNGIEHIHAEAGGWPHLVQLIAENVINVLNEGTAPHADAVLLQRALDKAIVSGDTVLRELMERESRLPGEWDYLRNFRRSDSQPPPDDEDLHRSLRRRLLVIDDNGLWRLRVPLMQHWLRARG